MSQYPYRGPGMGRGMGYGGGPRPTGLTQYFAPGQLGSPMHRNMGPGPDYEDGSSSYGMRSSSDPSPPGFGRGYGRGAPLPHHMPGTPRPSAGWTSASDTEGSMTGFESSQEFSRKTEESVYAKDCEILVLQQTQRRYAEQIERQLRETGLNVDMMFPKPGTKIQEFLKNFAKLGTIFAVVIDPECERGSTLNFYQFRGIPKPQYHKNVPITQAYSIMKKIYTELKRKEIGIVPDALKDVMARITHEDIVEDKEFTALIKYLHDRKRRQTLFLNRTSNVVQDNKTDVSSLIETPEGKALQKRILAILNEGSGPGDKERQ